MPKLIAIKFKIKYFHLCGWYISDSNCIGRNFLFSFFDFEVVTDMVWVLVYANRKVNKGEFSEINEYKLYTKPGHYRQLQE